ncbi:odorant receptor 131-2-like [Megalops cyprinoides]|uniref:odorant receptor 131-2-like n=1 Tax=Megalops cyprinoides TaxID=118141 RepID=UPI001865482F|nr:odorant receptor 131-2-like [Megalops cyprinoides]
MNSSTAPFPVTAGLLSITVKEPFDSAFTKNFIVVVLGCSINYINSVLVFTFFKHHEFRNNPRYMLYIHLVCNDILQLSVSVILHVAVYTWPQMNASLCAALLLIASFTSMNTPLNLAGMAVERHIAICNPLRHTQICTVRRTYILITLIWGVGAIPGLADLVLALLYKPLTFFHTNLMCYIEAVFNSPQTAVKNNVSLPLYMSFVWLTLIYTYLRVLLTAKSASTDPVSARKARNTILLHGAQLLLCMLAYISPTVNVELLSLFPKYRSHVLFMTYLISHIMPRVLSPLIYGIRDEKFWKHLKDYWLCADHRRKVTPEAFMTKK